MEVFLEFLITAVLSVLLAFGLGLLFSPVGAGDQAEPSAAAVPEAGPQRERTKVKVHSVVAAQGPGSDRSRESEAAVREEEAERECKEEEERLEVNEVRLEGGFVREIMAEVVGVEKIVGDLVGEEERREMPQEVEVVTDGDRVAIGEEEVVRSAGEEIVLKEGFESEIAGEGSDDHEKRKLLFIEKDEWEGIEKTELEKNFGEPAAYIGNGSGVDCMRLRRRVLAMIHSRWL